MNIDVVDLKEFYRSAPAGKIQSVIKKMLTRLRHDNSSKKTLFLGFGTPYISQTKSEFILMHAHFGALTWPDHKNNRVALSHERDWAFANHTFDEIILVHGLEYAQNTNILLQECYRCLHPEGRVIIIAPNRRSIWTHNSKTPFSFGQPYTLSQLSLLLKKNDFIPVDATRGLYFLSSSTWFTGLVSRIFEYIAPKALQKLSGLIGIAAIKRVYAGIPAKKREKQYLVIPSQQQVPFS